MTSPAGAHAERLLASLGWPATVRDDSDPVADWADSGAMMLTGRADGPPLVCTGPAVALRGALLALASLTDGVELPGLTLLGERAAVLGLSRAGGVSCGGATRLLPASDGVVCVALPREDDLVLVPALIEGQVGADVWDDLAAWLQSTPATDARDRAAMLGLACSVVGEETPDLPWRIDEHMATPAPAEAPLVVDLSSLWAGPLCASLLRLLGCRVLKVEDPRRPDGARRGPAQFFDLLNSGAESVSVDFTSADGRRRLRELVSRADVVIEGSRPRALRQLGLAAEDVVAEADQMTWVSITAYGRDYERVGFGDDTAAAGGLVVDGCFVAGAIADPLTGVHAALAAWSSVLKGGTRLVDVALSRVAAAAAALTGPAGRAVWRKNGWYVETSRGLAQVRDPLAREAAACGPALL